MADGDLISRQATVKHFREGLQEVFDKDDICYELEYELPSVAIPSAEPKIDIVKLCIEEELRQIENYNHTGNKWHEGFAAACRWVVRQMEGEQP